MPFCRRACRFTTDLYIFISVRGARALVRRGLLIVTAVAALATVSPAETVRGERDGDAVADEPSAGSGRTYPSLPDALHEAPEWLKKNAPFDIEAFFLKVPTEENAATLYLELFYEFAPQGMEPCVSPEEREARGPLLREREERTHALQREGGGDAAARAAVLEEYAEAFERLALAQKRKRCVFETGFSLIADFHHAQAARDVVRLLNWRVEAALQARNIDAALDDIEMGLRLGCDLRPRGPLISQLVSIALDSVIVQGQIYGALGSSELTVAHCDRLLKILAAEPPDVVDPAVEGFRGEYIFFRDLLHRLETGERLGDLVGAPASSNGLVLASRMAEGGRSRQIGEQLDERLSEMGPAEFAAEVDALNRYFAPLVDPKGRSIRELDRLLPEQEQALADMTVVSLLDDELRSIAQSIEAFRRDKTRMGAIQCVVALRRWQLAEPGRRPPDLEAVCKAAGMKGVPTDEYSRTGEPLRWITQGGQFVVYSVARDGKDDKAQQDWNFGRNPGDFIFRVPAVLEQ
jgi:hypothetical protein